MPGSKASICLLYRYNMDVEILRSTGATGAMPFEVPNNLRAFWPFGLFVAGFQADGNVERRPKGSEIRSIFFRIVCPFCWKRHFCRKIPSFIIGHWSMYHTAMEQASLVMQCAVAWQNQLRGASWPFLLEFLLEQHCLWSFDCVIREAIKNALCN